MDIVIKYHDGSYGIHHKNIGDKKQNADAILPNLRKFYKYSIGVTAYYCDSLYFMFLPTNTAKYIFKNILYTKVYPVCSMIVFAILATATQIYSYFFSEYDFTDYLLTAATCCIAIVCSLSYILSANIPIVLFIVQTFNFWYKMYNLTLWIASRYFVLTGYSRNPLIFVIGSLATGFGYGLAFVIDALSTEIRYKNLFVITLAIWSMSMALRVYFLFDDTDNYWNPFDRYNFKYSRINFKSVFVSSQINSCLFMLKPIFSQINRKMRNCIQNKQNKGQNVEDDGSFV